MKYKILIMSLCALTASQGICAAAAEEKVAAAQGAALAYLPIPGVLLKGRAENTIYNFAWLYDPVVQDSVLIRYDQGAKPTLLADGTKNFLYVNPIEARVALPSGLYYWQPIHQNIVRTPLADLVSLNNKDPRTFSKSELAMISEAVVSKKPQKAKLFKKGYTRERFMGEQNGPWVVVAGPYVDAYKPEIKWDVTIDNPDTVTQNILK